MPVFEERFTVAAPVDVVWAFLTDPRRVGACVPGATAVEVVDDRTFRLALTVKVGFLGTTQDVEVRDVPYRHRGEDYEEKYSEGPCKVEREWKRDGTYNEKLECKGYGQ